METSSIYSTLVFLGTLVMVANIMKIIFQSES